jgi:hypothetical protein
LCAFFYSFTIAAKTLREMAIQSSILLAASEQEFVAKKCKLSHDQISKHSHKLSDADLKILVSRASTCQLECTCSIYGLALQERGIQNSTMERLAATETATDRLGCLKKIKNYCALIK